MQPREYETMGDGLLVRATNLEELSDSHGGRVQIAGLHLDCARVAHGKHCYCCLHHQEHQRNILVGQEDGSNYGTSR
jgi:hypothetical protein